MKRMAMVLLMVMFAEAAFAWVDMDGLVIEKRFDHSGGTGGYHLGDVAAFRQPIYDRISKAAYAKWAGDYGIFTAIDPVRKDMFYNVGMSLLFHSSNINSPRALAVSPDGNVFLSDSGTGFLYRFTNTGSSLLLADSLPLVGAGALAYFRGIVFVAHSGGYTVSLYTSNLISTNRGEVANITLDAPVVGLCANDQYIFLLTPWNIVQVDRSGTRTVVPLDGVYSAQDIGVDPYGTVSVLDGGGYIRRFRDGKAVCSFLTPGYGDYAIASPTGLTQDPDDGSIIVADAEGIKRYLLSAAVTNFAPVSSSYYSGNRIFTNAFSFVLSMDSSVSVRVYDASSNFVRLVTLNAWLSAGGTNLWWDGKDMDGTPVVPGNYRLVLEARANLSAANTATASFEVQVCPAPVIALDYFPHEVMNSTFSTLPAGFQVSTSMRVRQMVESIDSEQSWDIGEGAYSIDGLVILKYSRSQFPDGLYRLNLLGTDPAGNTCSASTNFIVNYHPLALSILSATTNFSPLNTNASLKFTLSEPAMVELSITNGNGRLMRALNCPAGTNTITWDGNDALGASIADGGYGLQLRAHQLEVDAATNYFRVNIDRTSPGMDIGLTNGYFSPLISSNTNDSFLVTLRMREASVVSAWVEDSAGTHIKDFSVKAYQSNEAFLYSWQGVSNTGGNVEDGEYSFSVRAQDSVSNISFKQAKVTVDNNRSPESQLGQSTVRLLKTLTSSDYNFYWLRRFHKLVWLNQSGSMNLKAVDEDGRNERILPASKPINYYPNGILSPDEKYYACFGDPGDNYKELIRVYNLETESEMDGAESPYSFASYYPAFPSFFDSVFSGAEFRGKLFVSVYGLETYPSFALWDLQSDTFFKSPLTYDSKPSWLVFSPDDQAVVWANFGYTKVYNFSNHSVSYTLPEMGFIKWLNALHFLGYRDGRIQMVDINTGAVTPGDSVSQTPIEISSDGKTLLMSDGTHVTLYDMEKKTTNFLAEFEYISGNSSSLEPRKYRIFLSEDNQAVILSASLNGIRGIYRIDLPAYAKKNLYATIISPNSVTPYVSGNVTITGSAQDLNFDRFELSFRLAGVSNDLQKIVSRNPVDMGVLGNFDTSDVASGSNLVTTLSVYDLAGNRATVAVTNLVLHNPMNILLSAGALQEFAGTNFPQSFFWKTADVGYGEPVRIRLDVKDVAGKSITPYENEIHGVSNGAVLCTKLASLADGRVSWTITASHAGFTNIKTGSFVLDNTVPNMVFRKPDSVLTTDPRFSVILDCQEPNPASIALTIDGSDAGFWNALPVGGVLYGGLMTSDGLHTVSVSVLDQASNVNSVAYQVFLDTSAPVCSIEPSVGAQVYRRTVPFLGASVDANLAYWSIRLSNGTTNFIATNSAAILFSSNLVSLDAAKLDGKYSLTLTALDRFGLSASASRDVMIDNRPPGTALYVGSLPIAGALVSNGATAWLKQGLPVDLVATSGDLNSTVADTRVSVNDASYVSLSHLLLQSGSNMVRFYSVDSTGNTESTQKTVIFVDGVIPSVTANINGLKYLDSSSNIVYVPISNGIAFNASDAGSGIDSVRYSADGGASWGEWISGFGDGLMMISSGLTTIRYFAQDRVGNASGINEFRVFLDPAPPVTELSVTGEVINEDDTYYHRGVVHNRLSVSDFGSGAAWTRFRWNGGAWSNRMDPPDAGAATATLEYESADRVSNKEIRRLVRFVIDETPSVSVWKSDRPVYTNGIYYVPAGASLITTATDALCGLEAVTASLNGGAFSDGRIPVTLPVGTNQYRYASFDRLSNGEADHSVTVVADGKSPVTTIRLISGRQEQLSGRLYCQPGSVFSLDAADDLSGVAGTTLVLNGTTYSTNRFAISATGTNTLRFFSTDHVGNAESENTLSLISPIPDTMPPVFSTNWIGNVFVSSTKLFGDSNLAFQLIANDPVVAGEITSGIASVSYAVKGVWSTVSGTMNTIHLDTGSNLIAYCAVDNMGNVSVTQSVVCFVDTGAPSTAINYAYAGWTNMPVSIQMSPFDTNTAFESGIDRTEYAWNGPTNTGTSVTLSSEGVTTFRYGSIDKVNNRETWKTVTVKIDTQKPLALLSWSGLTNAIGGDIFAPSNLLLTLSGSDSGQSGLSAVRFIFNGLSTAAPVVTNLKPVAGSNYLQYYALDNAGNSGITNAAVFFVDTNAPRTFPNYSFNGWTNTAVTLSLSAYDTNSLKESGIARTELETNGDVRSGTIAVISNDGSNVIRYASVDRVSNRESWNVIQVKIDRQRPSAILTTRGMTNLIDGKVFADTNLEFTISAFDNGPSGLSALKYTFNGATSTTNTSSIKLKPVIGSNYLLYYALDNAGNSSATDSVVYFVDGQAPVTVALYSNANWTNTSVNLMFDPRDSDTQGGVSVAGAREGQEATATALESGVAWTELSTGGTTISGTNLLLMDEGIWEVFYRSADRVSNRETQKSIQVMIDKHPPSQNLAWIGLRNYLDGKWFGDTNLRVRLVSQDNAGDGITNSGLALVSYGINGVWINSTMATNEIVPIKGSNCLQYFSVDRAGNTTSTQAVVFFVDAAPPLTTVNYNYSGWTNSPVALAFAAVDAATFFESGVSRTEFRTNGVTEIGNALVVSNEGISTVGYYSIDRVSNREAPRELEVRIDRTSPELWVTGVSNGQKVGTNGLSPIMHSRDLSTLLLSAALTRNGISVKSWISNSATNSLDIPLGLISGEGKYQLRMTAEDAAWNTSILVLNFEVDRTAPQVPSRIRHLFDSRYVYLEWESVTNRDHSFYRLYKDGLPMTVLTNSLFIDPYADSLAHRYSVASVDDVGNESVKTAEEAVNTSDRLSFTSPDTNRLHYFNRWMWIRALYTDDGGETVSNRCERPDFNPDVDDDEDKDLERWLSDANVWSGRWLDHHNQKKETVALDWASSNALVPLEFNDILERQIRERRAFSELLHVDDLADGPYVLRIKSEASDRPIPLEDAVWFGVDDTPPVTLVSVNGIPVLPEDTKGKSKKTVHLNVPTGADLKLLAVDPIVNGAAAGVVSTLYKIEGSGLHINWKEYLGETIKLPSGGHYSLRVRSRDAAEAFWGKSGVCNAEWTRVYEIDAGNYALPADCRSNTLIPLVAVDGIKEYGVYTNFVNIDCVVRQAVSSGAKLDGKPVSLPLRVTEKGNHLLYVWAVNGLGVVVAREIGFTVAGDGKNWKWGE